MAVFRTRARTVDMLGRQQIASVSTAISEVFKNAHDAYASEVRGDLIVELPCLLIRDDGVGMTKAEFERNWLTLATDTKTTGERLRPPKGMRPRPVLGAKGIGRLAIAVVGRHALVLTRSRKAGSELVYAFVNWQMFVEPEVDLDEVEVPLGTIDQGRVPSRPDVRRLLSQARKNIEKVARPDRVDALLADLDAFDASSVDLLAELDGPRLTGRNHGTQFLISPVDDEAVTEAADLSADAELTTNLIGFADTMTPGHETPALATSFWVHMASERVPRDILATTEFLTVDEFWEADHQITGAFDAYGTFQGEVRVYGGKPQPYRVPWRDATGLTKCASFDLAIAIIQPRASESRMRPADHQRLNDKLATLGGIYVYRDGIRVLPYGRPDVDWLDIEETRTKRLGTGYYSHRRMFGAVAITNATNGELQEKAGREGFQQNTAYRQLRALLKGFLRQSAADFFLRGGEYSGTFHERKDAAARRAAARRKREQAVGAARDRFSEQLTDAYVRIKDGDAAMQVAAIVSGFKVARDLVLAGESPSSVEVEQYRAVSKLRDLQHSLTVEPPPDLGLTRGLKRDFGSYQAAMEEFERLELRPARRQLEELGNLSGTSESRYDTPRVLREGHNRMRPDVDGASEHLRLSVAELGERAEALIKEVSSVLQEGTSQLLRADPLRDAGSMSVQDYLARRAELEAQVEELYVAAMLATSGFSSAVDQLVWQRDGGSIVTPADVSAALDEEISELRESAAESLDLIQLGMTLTIVDHEFQLIIRSMRSAMRELRGWADLNPGLAPLVDSLEFTFEHLDGYLTLLTPLQRTLSRRRTAITGEDLHRFLIRLFQARLEEADIVLSASKEFREHTIRGYRSTWYPVFVNLIDNAVHWVAESRPPREILLDMDDDVIVVADSGRGVGPEDRDLIFEPRFTLKPGGRGLGLTISREALSREGYRLDVTTHDRLGGAAFTIRRASQT